MPAREGGRRCAAHTRPKYETGIAAVKAARGIEARTDAQVEAMADIARHASTRAGEKEVMAARERALQDGQVGTAFYLASCLNIGHEMRTASQQVEEDIKTATDEARHTST